jgi:hypothetical protein
VSNRPEYARRHREKRARLLVALKSHPCSDCGVAYPPYVMHFDHRDPSTKLFDISTAVRTRQCSWTRVLEEIAKCDLVCANCHAERTHQRRVA